MKTPSLRSIVMIMALCTAAGSMAAGRVAASSLQESRDPLQESREDYQARLRWFTEARFGMFIHWGPVSLKGTEIGWSRGRQVPRAEYDALYKRFNPTRFDAAEWVAVAKRAGMKYIVFTSKHHDGFTMFDSKLTDYDIMATPYGKDIMRALADECRKQGLVFCTYYSILDWYHPDYNTAGSHGGPGYELPPGTKPDMDRYVAYMKGQLREIIQNYGPIGILWFDGEWEAPWTPERGRDLYRYCRSLQPDIIVNNRVGKGRHGMAGGTKGSEYAGDYDTPEQRIGSFQMDRPWETCMTICRQWAWKPNDQLKSLEQCLHTLIRTAGGDGNLLFNVGPMPDGRIEPRQVERLEQMGRWLARYGQSIYATRGGPFKPGPWGVSTRSGRRIFVHILKPPHNRLMLPAIDAKIESATLLTGGHVTVEQTDQGISVTIPATDIQPIDTIVVLNLDRDALRIKPVNLPSDSLAYKKKASASNVFRNMNDQYGPAMAFDDDPDTRWATDGGTRQAWLAVDLGREQAFDQVHIAEAYAPRVRKFQLQVKKGATWTTVYEGTTLGPDKTLRIPPVTARYVRLNILDATDGPTIQEFQVMKKRD